MNANAEVLKIIIADDHALTRYGLMTMLRSRSDLRIIAEASNGQELVELTRTYRPDIILTDIEMPEMDGLTATRIIATEFPEIAIIGLSMHDNVNNIVDMLEAGAKGYLLKNADKEEALRAIERVKNNESYYCGKTGLKLAKLLSNGVLREGAKKEVLLTEREKIVIHLICEEYTSKEIAEELNLGIRTIDGYRESIMQKTESHNIVGIVKYALRNNLYKA